MTMQGKVAIVTGASRGIGEFIARRFAVDGAAVAVSARTVEEGDHKFPGSVASTVRSIIDSGGTAIGVAADLSKQEDRARLIETAEKELGPVDILVNNAAITYFEPVDGFSESHYRLMFEVQVRAPFELAQLVVPGMKERKSGWILNISSGAARHPVGPPYVRGAGRGGTVYGMCKAAIERLSTGLAAEVYGSGVAVNALSPNRVVPTPGTIFHHLTTEDDPNAEPPQVMAAAALALCSGDPASLTGRIAYSQDLLNELGLEVGA